MICKTSAPGFVRVFLLSSTAGFAALCPGATLAATPNQTAVGQAVSAAGAGDPVSIALANLAVSNPSAVPGALNELSGEIHASLPSAMIEDSRMIRDTVLDRLAFPASEGFVQWGAGYGDFGRIGGDTNAASVHRNDSGAIVGFDTRLGSRLRVGIAGAFTGQNVNIPARLSNANGVSDHLIVYANWAVRPLALSLSVDQGWGSDHVTRDVAFLSETYSSHQNTGLTQVFGEARYRAATRAATLEPYIDLVWLQARTGEFIETDGLGALSGGDDTQHETYVTLGLRSVFAGFDLAGAGVAPRISAAWQHAFNTFLPTETLAFAGGGSAFSIAGAPLANNAADIEAGFDVTIMPALVVSVGYDGQLANTVHSNAVDGRIAWRF